MVEKTNIGANYSNTKSEREKNTFALSGVFVGCIAVCLGFYFIINYELPKPKLREIPASKGTKYYPDAVNGLTIQEQAHLKNLIADGGRLYAQGDTIKAINFLHDAYTYLQTKPKRTPRDSWDAYLLYGDTLCALKLTDNAEKVYYKWFSDCRKSYSNEPLLAIPLIKLAAIKIDQKKFADADKLLDQAVLYSDRDPTALVKAAIVKEMLGKSADSETLLKHWRDSGRGGTSGFNAAAYSTWIEILKKQGRIKESIALQNEAERHIENAADGKLFQCSLEDRLKK